MVKIRGIYDGERVRLLESVAIPPNTEVEVLVPDQQSAAMTGEPDPGSAEQRDEEYLRRLAESGIITRARCPEEWDDSFEPVQIEGEPISETIIRERR
jgi:hypothetical protein